jgi:hypothetical protein
MLCFDAKHPHILYSNLFFSVHLLDILHISLRTPIYPARIGLKVLRHALHLILMMVQGVLHGRNVSSMQ